MLTKRGGGRSPMASQLQHEGGNSVRLAAGANKKTPGGFPSGVRIKSLAVTYFHIDKANTSIGAERFHFRVRKGIGWFPLAMAARQTGCNGRVMARPPRIRTICFDVCRNQVSNPIPDLQTLEANRLGVIWSSLTGN